MAEPSVLQKKTEIFLERDIYPLLKNFPASEKFSLCQEIKQSCYKLIRAAVMANNLTNVNRRLMWLDEADAEKTLLLVLLGVAKNQKYITQAAIVQSVNSWLGFARWACAYNLAKKIFAPYRFIKTEGELPYGAISRNRQARRILQQRRGAGKTYKAVA